MADSEKPEPNKGLKAVMKYSGMAFQMGIIIAGGVFFGSWLDKRAEHETSWYTIGIGLFSIFVALYVSLKDLLKTK